MTNVDLRDAMEGHKVRRKKDNSAIMTVLLQEVGGWGLEDDEEKKEDMGSEKVKVEEASATKFTA